MNRVLLSRIEAEARTVLTYIDHASQKEQLERAIVELNMLTRQYIDTEMKPPDLGISVGDGVGMGEVVG